MNWCLVRTVHRITAFSGRLHCAQKLFASSSRRSDIPELLQKKHRKLQARSAAGAGSGGDEDEDEDDEGMDTDDEVLTDTNDDETVDLRPKNGVKRKSDDSSDVNPSPTKKTKPEVLHLLIRAVA